MESLAADRKSSLDLVQLSLAHLIKHCEAKRGTSSGNRWLYFGQSNMKTKLQLYETKLVQLSSNSGGVLKPANPDAIRPSKAAATQGQNPMRFFRNQYADKMQSRMNQQHEPVFWNPMTTLFEEALFAGSSSAPAALQENANGVPLPVGDEVD